MNGNVKKLVVRRPAEVSSGTTENLEVWARNIVVANSLWMGLADTVLLAAILDELSERRKAAAW